MAIRDMTERGGLNPSTAKERREAKVRETAAAYQAMDAVGRLRIEEGALEDSILSCEGHPRGSKSVNIQTERGFVLNCVLVRTRNARAAIEDPRAKALEQEKANG
jgi:hypothetical protein